MRLFLASLLLVALSAGAQTKKPDPVDQIAATLTPTRQIVYKKVQDRELHLDMFHPEGWKAEDRRACFIIIHGGGWVGGEPKRMYPFAAHFAKLGMVGISVQYRLCKAGSGVTPFECVRDGRSAVRYVRSHAKELGIDPEKIIVSGGSAGGHVAASTTLFAGPDEAGEDATVSSKAKALVLLFPVIDTSKEGYGNARCGEHWQDISPLHQVKAGLPPTLVFHGTGDTVCPYAGAKAFDEAMHKAGNRCELITNEGGRHGYLMFDRALLDETLKKTEVFLASLKMLQDGAR